MCNTVLSPVNCLEEARDFENLLKLRRCRSFGDLALHDKQFVSGLPGLGRNGSLKRRTNSTEDLIGIATRNQQDSMAMPGVDRAMDLEMPCIEEQDNVENGPPSPQTNGIAIKTDVLENVSSFTVDTTDKTDKLPPLHPVISPLSSSSLLVSESSSPVATSAFISSNRNSLDDRRNSSDLGTIGPTTGHLADGHAAEELFYRLNHARQTVDYVKRQAATFSTLQKSTMSVWEALDMLNSLREYEAALLGDDTCDPDMPLLDHAMQTAELCRITFPEHDWMALVGLLHGIGKLLAHSHFGAEPQWAICGESFPVGCRFHPAIVHSQFFQANPDRRRRVYASATGMYQPGCGLNAVCMSWSSAEYLFMVIAMNRTALPKEALFLLRYQKFASLLASGQPYNELLSSFDKKMLPTLAKFRELVQYKKMDVPGMKTGEEFRSYYDGLIAKYIPQGQLRF